MAFSFFSGRRTLTPTVGQVVCLGCATRWEPKTGMAFCPGCGKVPKGASAAMHKHPYASPLR